MRNAGNIVPHSQHFADELTMCEPAALELGCVVNDIRHVIVCGHSDCKAMNLLYELRDEEFASQVRSIIILYMNFLCHKLFQFQNKLWKFKYFRRIEEYHHYGLGFVLTAAAVWQNSNN